MAWVRDCSFSRGGKEGGREGGREGGDVVRGATWEGLSLVSQRFSGLGKRLQLL